MKKTINLLTLVFLFSLLLNNTSKIYAQLPCNVLVGYYQTSWGNKVRLANINDKYNVICLAFLEAGNGDGNATNNSIDNLSFYHYKNAELVEDIPIVQAKGKKVLMSIGGASGSFKLNNDTEVATFVNKTKAVISNYSLDGIDIDLEQKTYLNQSGSISNPSAHIANLIKGLQQLLSWYQTTYNKKMILTLVPEAPYVTGGLSDYQTSTYGVAYLPVIEALKNDIDLLMVQLYNAGESYGLDGNIYDDGSVDYVVSQTEAIIKGFTCKGNRGIYSGIAANKVSVTLPATSGAAGSGYLSPAAVKEAMDYLRGIGPKTGAYSLKQAGGYPDLRAMTTWSVNVTKDAGDSFAANFASMFTDCPVTTGIEDGVLTETPSIELYPNPAQNQFFVKRQNTTNETLTISTTLGQKIIEKQLSESITTIDISTLESGVYIVQTGNITSKLLVK